MSLFERTSTMDTECDQQLHLLKFTRLIEVFRPMWWESPYNVYDLL